MFSSDTSQVRRKVQCSKAFNVRRGNIFLRHLAADHASKRPVVSPCGLPPSCMFHRGVFRMLKVGARRVWSASGARRIGTRLQLIPQTAQKLHPRRASRAEYIRRAPRRQPTPQTAYTQHVRRASITYVPAANTETPPIQEDDPRSQRR